MNAPAKALENKLRCRPLLDAIASSRPDSLKASLGHIYHDQAHWRGSHPLNDVNGIDAIDSFVWRPLLRALPDLERRDLIFVAGDYEARDYVASIGHFCGTFENDWLGIPSNGQPMYLRYGEVHQIVDGQIVQSSCLWDVLDFMRQAGFWPLAPSLGREGMWPGPITGNGLECVQSDAQTSARSINSTRAMHQALADYDDSQAGGRDGLLNMSQKNHWHAKMMWYGPGGIGTTRGLSGFVDFHQLPFRIAFPNRKGGSQWDAIKSEKKKLGGGHYIQIGDGNFSVTGGWPSVYAQP